MNGGDSLALGASHPDLWLMLVKSAGVLCLVLAVLIVFLYLLKRFLSLRGVQHRPDAIQMLACHHISPRQQVMLMDVMGEKILIGVTSQQITSLGCIHPQPDSRSSSDGGFDDVLQQAAGDNDGR